MTSNIDRLRAALIQADDGQVVSADAEFDELLQIEGTWEYEPLEGALATAFAPDGIVLQLEEVKGDAMYLRTVWAEGTTASDKPFEVSQSGVTLILEIGKFEGNDSTGRRVFKMPLENLVKAWLHSIGER